jgi:hypothetical protein
VLRKPLPQKWWIYGDKRPLLYDRLRNLKWALAIAKQATKYVEFAVIEGKIVFSHAVAIIASDSFGMFAALTSSFHKAWVRSYCSYNLALLRYSPSDVFDTFSMPSSLSAVDCIGERYYRHRRQIMLARQEGLTKTYNRFHGPDETAEDILKLRELHVEMDNAVAAAYGWTDLDLGHGFHKTKQGLRFTISEPARREVLTRLLKLNHERYAEEVAKGLHGKAKKGGAKTRKPRKNDEGLTLF